MKDKEFDQLFKDRLGEAEIEPSVNLWNNIAMDLKPHKRKMFPGYWIAAAVAIIIGSVVWMAPKEEKIKLQGSASLLSNNALPTSLTPSTMHVASKIDHRASKIEHKAEVNTSGSTPLVIAPRLNEVNSKGQFIVKRSVVAKTSTAGANQSDKNVESRSGNTTDHISTDIVIAKAELPDEIDANVITENEASTKGIRNVGDFVNYVVSKVDKREDKFLKFKTDDDNSSLVGINIGFIKLNLKRNK